MKTCFRLGLSALVVLYSSAALCTDVSAPVAELRTSQSLLNIPKSAFKPDPGDPSKFVYIKPGAHLERYHSILVAPLVVLQKGDASMPWQALVSDENGKAAIIFQQALIKALKSNGLRVATQPGPDVLTLRVAVTRIQQNREGFVMTDVLPIKAIFNVARMATGMEKYMVNIEALGQLENSQNGELLAGSLGLRKQSKSGTQAISLDDFSSWAKDWSQATAQRILKSMPSVRLVDGESQL